MPRDTKPASLHLRMAPQLLESLRAAAHGAGCSLNAFAVQVLSAAAGDAARFRGAEQTEARTAAVAPKQEWKAKQARNDFLRYMMMELGAAAGAALVARLDADDPVHYLEWQRRRAAGEIPWDPPRLQRGA